jgi:hypothetical protein
MQNRTTGTAARCLPRVAARDSGALVTGDQSSAAAGSNRRDEI